MTLAASHEMVRRRDAAQATLDRFKDKPFAFGAFDCVRMAAFHLRQFGYRPSLAKAGSYKSFKGARAALARAGFSSVAEALDALGLERIAPAAAVTADLVQLPGADDLGSLTVALGNGRVVGYHEHAEGAVVMQPVETIAAWRVRA